jgi:hypothetical protein
MAERGDGFPLGRFLVGTEAAEHGEDRLSLAVMVFGSAA